MILPDPGAYAPETCHCKECPVPMTVQTRLSFIVALLATVDLSLIGHIAIILKVIPS